MRQQTNNKVGRCLFMAALMVLLAYQASSANEPEVWEESYALEASGHYKAAAALIEPLIQGDGDVTEYALLRYGWLNYLLRNYNDAVRSYEKALNQNPKSIDAHLGISLPLLAQQRWDESARHAKLVLRQSPWQFIAHQQLLVSEEGTRNWQLMRKHAQELAARYPAPATAWIYLARAEASLGNDAAAKSAYVRVLRRQPANIEARTYLYKEGSK